MIEIDVVVSLDFGEAAANNHGGDEGGQVDSGANDFLHNLGEGAEH